MLPGAAPPVREPQAVPVDFDVPAQANTLHSANKVTVVFETEDKGLIKLCYLYHTRWNLYIFSLFNLNFKQVLKLQQIYWLPEM